MDLIKKHFHLSDDLSAHHSCFLKRMIPVSLATDDPCPSFLPSSRFLLSPYLFLLQDTVLEDEDTLVATRGFNFFNCARC